VLNKYYPPDFDPEKLVTRRRFLRQQGDGKKNRNDVKQMNVRMMMPFTMCCHTCGEFVYIGTKFNSRVERVRGEDYLGIVIWRFYGKCPNCRAEFAFKTDPKNTDYVLEAGGNRTYEPHKDALHAETSLKDQLANELEGDAMKALEYKTYSTANELLAIESLDELRKINKRLLNREQTVSDTLKWLNDSNEVVISSELTEEEQKDLDDAKLRGGWNIEQGSSSASDICRDEDTTQINNMPAEGPLVPDDCVPDDCVPVDCVPVDCVPDEAANDNAKSVADGNDRTGGTGITNRTGGTGITNRTGATGITDRTGATGITRSNLIHRLVVKRKCSDLQPDKDTKAIPQSRPRTTVALNNTILSGYDD